MMEAVMDKIQIAKYPAYKESGVEWIEEIPKHWQVVRVKDVCEMIVSNVDKHTKPIEKPVKLCNYVDVYKNDFITGDIEFMNATASNDEIKRFKIKINDVLITKDSEDWLDIGVPALVKYEEDNLICGYHLAILRPHEFMVGSFLHRALLSAYIKTQFSINANGVTRYGISHRAILGTFIAIPPFEEQTAIAEFLDGKTALIDKAIGIKEKQIELLKERRQISIHLALTRGLNPKAKMKDSGVEWIGEIPGHWEVLKVKRIFRLIIVPAPKNNNHELLSLYTDIGVKPRAELEERGNKASTTDGYWLVKRGDIVVNKLLAWMGAIGISNYDGVTSPAYDILRAIRPIDGNFFHNLFRTPICISELRKHSRGIMDMRLRLYFDKFGDVLVPFPTHDEQILISEYIDHLNDKIATAISLKEKEIEKLKEYKAILVNSAVTGRIKVC